MSLFFVASLFLLKTHALAHKSFHSFKAFGVYDGAIGSRASAGQWHTLRFSFAGSFRTVGPWGIHLSVDLFITLNSGGDSHFRYLVSYSIR
jgi:hypothetical protein